MLMTDSRLLQISLVILLLGSILPGVSYAQPATDVDFSLSDIQLNLDSMPSVDQTTQQNDMSVFSDYFNLLLREDGSISNNFADKRLTYDMYQTYLALGATQADLIDFENFLSRYYDPSYTYLFSYSPHKTQQAIEPNYIDENMILLQMWLDMGNTLTAQQVTNIKADLQWRFDDLKTNDWFYIEDFDVLLSLANYTGFTYDAASLANILVKVVNTDLNSNFYGGVSNYYDPTCDCGDYNLRYIADLFNVFNELGLNIGNYVNLNALKNYVLSLTNHALSQVGYFNPYNLDYSLYFETNPNYSTDYTGFINYFDQTQEMVENTMNGLVALDLLNSTVGPIYFNVSGALDLIQYASEIVYWKDSNSDGILDRTPLFDMLPYPNDLYNLNLHEFVSRFNRGEWNLNTLASTFIHNKLVSGGYTSDNSNIGTLFDLIDVISNSNADITTIFSQTVRDKMANYILSGLVNTTVSYNSVNYNISTIDYDYVYFLAFNQSYYYGSYIGSAELTGKVVQVLNELQTSVPIPLWVASRTNQFADYYALSYGVSYFYSPETIYNYVSQQSKSASWPNNVDQTAVLQQLNAFRLLSGAYSDDLYTDSSTRIALGLHTLNQITVDFNAIVQAYASRAITSGNYQGWPYRLDIGYTTINFDATVSMLRFLYKTNSLQGLLDSGQLSKANITNLLVTYANVGDYDNFNGVFSSLYETYNQLMGFFYLGYTESEISALLPTINLNQVKLYIASLQLTNTYTGGFGYDYSSGSPMYDSYNLGQYTSMAVELLVALNGLPYISLPNLTSFVQSQQITDTSNGDYGLFKYSADATWGEFEATSRYLGIVNALNLSIVTDVNLRGRLIRDNYNYYYGNRDVFNSQLTKISPYMVQDLPNLIGFGGITQDFLANMGDSIKNLVTVNMIPTYPGYQLYQTDMALRTLDLFNQTQTTDFDTSMQFVLSLQNPSREYYWNGGDFAGSYYGGYWGSDATLIAVQLLNDFGYQNSINRNDLGYYIGNQLQSYLTNYNYWYNLDETLNLYQLVLLMDNSYFGFSYNMPIYHEKNAPLYLGFNVIDLFGNTVTDATVKLVMDGSEFTTSFDGNQYSTTISGSNFATLGDRTMTLNIYNGTSLVTTAVYTFTVLDQVLSYIPISAPDAIGVNEDFVATGYLAGPNNVSMAYYYWGYGWSWDINPWPNTNYGLDVYFVGDNIEISLSNYGTIQDGYYTISVDLYFDLIGSITLTFEVTIGDPTTDTTTTSSPTTNDTTDSSSEDAPQISLPLPGIFFYATIMVSMAMLGIYRRRIQTQ